MRKNAFLRIIKTANFPAYAAILLFYFHRLFVTSYGWGCSCVHVSPRVMNAQPLFLTLHAFPSRFSFLVCLLLLFPIRWGSQAAPYGTTSEMYRVIPFRYKIDPFLKCVALFSLFVFTYTREQANENLSTIRSIKKQTYTNKNSTTISILFFLRL